MLKKLILVAILLFAVTLNAQTFGTANEGAPMPTVSNPIISFPAIATTSFSVGAVTPVVCPTLPAGTKGFYIICTNGLCYGSASITANLGTTSLMTASNTAINSTTNEFKVSSMHPSPVIYFLNHVAGATATAYIIPYK